MGARAVEEVEDDQEEAGREPTCGDWSGGDVARNARRAWARQSSVKTGQWRWRRIDGKWGMGGGNLGMRAADGG